MLEPWQWHQVAERNFSPAAGGLCTARDRPLRLTVGGGSLLCFLSPPSPHTVFPEASAACECFETAPCSCLVLLPPRHGSCCPVPAVPGAL